MTRTALILGPTGRFARHAATAFEAAGWTLRLFNRHRDDLNAAAQGADVIVNGWNPPYTSWHVELPGLTRRIIAAAERSGATVIIPGNVYLFGAGTPAPWSDESAQGATNPLGRLRIEMEQSYRESRARVIVLRGGDYIDTEASGNWFDKVLTARLDRGILTYPGNPDIPHAWAYLPDIARAAVALVSDGSSLPRFADIPFPGYTLSGMELRQQIEAATQQPLRLRRMSWLPLQLAAPFWPLGRRLIEMRYLWNTPHSLDGAALAHHMPDFRPTPPIEALRGALTATA